MGQQEGRGFAAARGRRKTPPLKFGFLGKGVKKDILLPPPAGSNL
jgi:hypothetical protein